MLHEGDRVLVRNMTPRGGTGKLRNHWEDCIHKVIRQVGKDMPIYEVLSEQGKGRGSRILHRNLLLPCDHLLLEIQLKSAKQKRQIPAQTSGDREEPNQEEDDDECDNDDYGYYYMSRVQPLPVMQPQVNTGRENADRELTAQTFACCGYMIIYVFARSLHFGLEASNIVSASFLPISPLQRGVTMASLLSSINTFGIL